MADPCCVWLYLVSGRGVLELRLAIGDATGDTDAIAGGVAADEFGVVGGQQACNRGGWG